MESNHPKKALQTFPWPLGFRAIKSKLACFCQSSYIAKSKKRPEVTAFLK
jgi:hypothetical protein